MITSNEASVGAWQDSNSIEYSKIECIHCKNHFYACNHLPVENTPRRRTSLEIIDSRGFYLLFETGGFLFHSMIYQKKKKKMECLCVLQTNTGIDYGKFA